MKKKIIIDQIELNQLKTELPKISIGDSVTVGILIDEGNKQRVQSFKGTVIAQRQAGINSTIVVRCVLQGVGIERVFLLHSPLLKKIEITRRAKVRRGKLYYLRDRVGKKTKLKQRLSKQR